jgi:hypothetical protein
MNVNVEIEGLFKEKVERIKNHIKEHKEKYIIGATCVMAGLATGYVVGKRRGSALGEAVQATTPVMSLDRCKIKDSTFLQQTISVYGNVIGRPGNEVIDLTNGKIFGSQTLAALDTGVSNDAMFKHLQGDYDNLNGRQFARLKDIRATMPDFEADL